MVITEEVIHAGSGVVFGNQILILVSAPLLEQAPKQGNGHLIPVRPLAIHDEIEAIVDALRRSRRPVQFEIKVEIATIEAVRRIFTNDAQPAIIHFVGHGVQASRGIALILEDEFGLARPLYTEELQSLFQVSSTPPCRLAVLNACYSQGLAEVFLSAGVHHVVAINTDDKILDAAARSFASHFYPFVLANQTINEAFYYARQAVLNDESLKNIVDEQTHQPVNLKEALKFRLLPENTSEHQRRIEYEPVLGTVIRPKWKDTNIPPVSPDPFVGRRLDLHMIARHLRDPKVHRCILLQGMGGMGKTALALAVGRWHHERLKWIDGVWLIELRNISTVSQAYARIAATLDINFSTESSIVNALADRHILLILDDLDMLLHRDPDGLAELLRSLLGFKQVSILTTSRHDLPGKVLHQIYPLERMDRFDALIAFQNYAPPLEKWAVGNIYQEDLNALLDFLDGYPFPIRLAATYMKQTRCSLRQLRQRLEVNPRDTLRYPSDKEDRDTSLVSTLNLSYYALPPGARDVFPLLALFPAGLSEEAAHFILGEVSVSSLETLLQFSMAEERGPTRRFALPEPARRYAEAHQPSNVMDHYGLRALSFYHNSVKQAVSLLAGSYNEQGRWLLSLEQPNIKTFLEWGYEHEQSSDQISLSARTTALLVNYWKLNIGTLDQSAILNLKRALIAAQRCNDHEGEASVYKATGDIQQLQLEMGSSLLSYEKAIEIYKSLSDRLNEAQVQNSAGDIWHYLQNANKAIESYMKGLKLWEAEFGLHHAQEATMIAAAERLEQNRFSGERISKTQITESLKEVQELSQIFDRTVPDYINRLESYKRVSRLNVVEQVQEVIDDLWVCRRMLGDTLVSYINLLISTKTAINKLRPASDFT